MIISRCPRQAIEKAAHDTEVSISDIEALSSTGLRHRVKLKPSHHKTLKVEAGEKVFFKHTKAERERLMVIYSEVLQREMAPNELLTLAFRARLQDAVPLSERGVADIPDTKALCAELGVSLPTLQSLEKLAKAIVGTSRVAYRRIAPYQRRALTDHDRACAALCWHGFRDFFMKLFALAPAARCFTAFAVYDGKESFYKNYPQTGSRNIGSNFNPMHANEACWC